MRQVRLGGKVSHFELTQLQYSDDRKLPLRLYVYDAQGYYTRAPWVDKEADDETITVAVARRQTASAMGRGFEVRITNGSDFLVFHAKHGKVIHPADGDVAAFWRSVYAG
jgi:hypothetical protein